MGGVEVFQGGGVDSGTPRLGNGWGLDNFHFSILLRFRGCSSVGPQENFASPLNVLQAS